MRLRDQAKLRLAARAWAKRPKRFRTLGRLPSIPLAIEAGYVLRLRQLAVRVRDVTATRLAPLWAAMAAYPDAAHSAPTLRTLSVTSDLQATVRMLTQLEEHQRAAMNTYLSPLTGGVTLFKTPASPGNVRMDAVEPAVWRGLTPGARKVLNDALTDNVRLIKSIPEGLLDDVEATLREHLAAGSRVEVIQNALQERYDIGERRAARIARDQVGKVNGQLNEERSTEIGMDDYFWRCSGGGTPAHGDERVRPGHRVLDGTKQKFSNPPVVDEKSGRRCNPGEDVECRCTAEPNVDGYLDYIGA